MRIAQLVSNNHTVGPDVNFAIYSLVAWLTDKLVEKGHDVDLFATGDSVTRANLCSVTSGATADMDVSDGLRNHYMHLLISECYGRAFEFDVVHSHFNLLSSFYAGLTGTPTVHSLHLPIKSEMEPFFLHFKNSNYISFSLAQRKLLPELNWVANIYHGVDTERFKFSSNSKGYLLFLGRIVEDKGVHLAIKAALETDSELIIAGKSYKGGYWQNEIQGYIDGKRIRYVGEIDFKAKIEYLRGARALLFPTQCDEVFGLSMIEAMACGAPVIGWDKGSVSEIVADGKTGYVVKNLSGMVKAIQAIDRIDRGAVRRRAERFFSVDKMVPGYEKVYERVIRDKEYKERNGSKRRRWFHLRAGKSRGAV